MYDLNNRHIAIAFWITVVIVFSLVKSLQFRQSLVNVFNTMRSRDVAIVLGTLSTYTVAMATGISYAGTALCLMHTPPVFATLTWVLTSGWTLISRPRSLSGKVTTYARKWLSLIAPPALVSFATNLTVFHLTVELMLVPLLFVVSTNLFSSEMREKLKVFRFVVVPSFILVSSIALVQSVSSGVVTWVDATSTLAFSLLMGFAYLLYLAVILWWDRRQFLTGAESQLIIRGATDFTWPLTAPVAKVFGNGPAIWLMVSGVLYPLNGGADTMFRLHGIRGGKLERVHKLNKQYEQYGLRHNIGPVIDLGQALIKRKTVEG